MHTWVTANIINILNISVSSKVHSCSFALIRLSPAPNLLMSHLVLFSQSHILDGQPFQFCLSGIALAGIMLNYENEWEACSLATPLLVPSFSSFTSSRLQKDNVVLFPRRAGKTGHPLTSQNRLPWSLPGAGGGDGERRRRLLEDALCLCSLLSLLLGNQLHCSDAAPQSLKSKFHI